MKKPTLYPLMEREAFAPVISSSDAGLQADTERPIKAHVDYDHRPLAIGPLDHFDTAARPERFTIR